MHTKQFFKPLAQALAIASLAGSALAAPVVYNETNTGDLVAGAESAGDASGGLVINGKLLDGRGGFAPNLVDLFSFTVTAAGHYLVNSFGSDIADPSLFLFDGLGNGIYWNNDASLAPVDTQSAFGVNLAAGMYHIALSWYGMDADDGIGSIFDTLGNEGGPLPGAGALASWNDFSGLTTWDLTAYNINISLRVPEPGALALSLAALGLMAGAMRRRQALAA